MNDYFNPGAVIEKPSFKDFRFEFVAGAEPLPEEYSLRDKIFWIKDQNGSNSCVGQAFSYYAEVLNYLETKEKVKLSARDIYSLIYLPQGGAWLRDGAKKIVKSGVVLEKDAPSYINGNPPDEAFMRQRSDITEEEVERGNTYLAKSYVRIPERSFEAVKRAIYQYHGCVLGVIGDNVGWENPKNGIVKLPTTERKWGHAFYCTGWKKINEEEYIEFVNSWGENWGDNGFGYLSKNYFKKGLVFNPWCLIDMPNEYYNLLKKQASLLKRLIVLYKILIEKLWRKIKNHSG